MKRWRSAILAAAFLLACASPALAQDSGTSLKDKLIQSISNSASQTYDTSGTTGSSTLYSTFQTVFQYAFGAIGVAATLLVIYSGFLWLTAGGNDEQVAKAKKIIMQVVVGFIVLSLAYGIVSFTFSIINSAAGHSGPTAEEDATNNGGTPLGTPVN